MPEPLLKQFPVAELPEDLQAAHATSIERRGDATFLEVSGNAPHVMRWYVDRFYGELFYGGVVPNEICELARLRLSILHGCRTCNLGNRLDAMDAGISEEKINAIEDPDNDVFSPAERAVLRLAGRIEMMNPHGKLEPELYGELHEHFDDGQILELGMIMGVLTGAAKFVFAFDLVEKENYCPVR